MEKPTELVFEEKQLGNTPITQGYSRAASLAKFQSTVYPIVRSQTCVNCHSSETQGQSPIFADVNPEKAYDAITLSKKVDLVLPEASRIVMKVKKDGGQSHNCWSQDCNADSATLLEAVKDWATILPTTGNGTGIFTAPQMMPPENTKQVAQTEHGTIILQAEQPLYTTEVVDGRFVTEQQSSALDGKYLLLPAPDPNPHTAAYRQLRFNPTAFTDCKEFDQIPTTTWQMKFMQQKVHIPSGLTSGGKIVNDGYRPFTASLGIKIVRPDKRLEYAAMLQSGDFSGLKNVLIYDGAPGTAPLVPGTNLPNLFAGKALFTDLRVFVLPHFTNPATVFQSNGQFVQSGTYTKDDGTVEQLHNLFKDGIYSPAPYTVFKQLLKNGPLKHDILYKRYRETISGWFYNDTTPKASRSQYTYDYNKQIYSMNVSSYFVPHVSVKLQCPNEPVNPTQPESPTNPRKDCTATPSYLKYHVTAQSGDPLVQNNALQCMTLNAGKTDFVPVASSFCDTGTPGYFHYMDVFAHFGVFENSSYGPKTLAAYQSTTPGTYQDYETLMANPTKNISIPNPAPGNDMNLAADPGDVVELDPDVFFSGGGRNISEADNLENFRTTLYPKLRAARCVDCHGDGDAARPQFASPAPATALSALESGGYINFSAPSSSFRPNGMIHNCNPANPDPRYSCDDTAENALRASLIAGVAGWKAKNDALAASQGQASFRSLTAKERKPGRVKYRLKITEAGNYNLWLKVKKVDKGSRLSYRILNDAGAPVRYLVGANNTPVANSCYSWNMDTLTDNQWEWTSPGRAAELSAIDQKGYLRLDNNKQPLPLPNQRLYYPLAVGEYVIDIIGTSEDLKLDAVGLNLVPDMTVDSRLLFQPDRRAIDEKNVSDYKRKVLRYDLTTLLNLSSGKSAYFEIEVKKDFNNQNYIFRNPRFKTSSPDFNIKVKSIQVYINGKYNYPDATYNNFEGVVGDGRVITYAPLVALTEGDSDAIKFRFGQLSVSNESLSILYPKGTPAAPITDRRCNELDFFVKNVKPILRNSKMMLTNELNDTISIFPGGPKQIRGMPQTYNCISCHTVNHPYFKMATFTNDEEFCREAISRVDFQNFYQSLVIRGINGTGNHPKFVFIEKFINDSTGNFKVHDGAQDHVLGHKPVQIEMGLSLAAVNVTGPFMLWNKADLGFAAGDNRSFSQLSLEEQNRIKLNGHFRALEYKRVDMNVINYPWFRPEVHSSLLYDDDDPSIEDNILSVKDVIHPDPAIGRLELDRDGVKAVYVVKPLSSELNLVHYKTLFEGSGAIPLKATLEPIVPNGQPGIKPENIDYIASTPEKNTAAEMAAEFEILRDYYREKVIEWIRRENAAREAGN